MTERPWIREGYRSLNPYLVVERVEPLLAFLTEVFGGAERGEREIRAGGSIGHAEFGFGDSVLMLADCDVLAGLYDRPMSSMR